MKILIVDDSASARDIVSVQLGTDKEIQIVGYAENGKEAVELNNVLNPDLILMDVEMPIMNGIQATELIMRQNPKPIVILTAARYDGPTVQAANDAGAVWILDKPELGWDRNQISEFCGHLKFLSGIPMPKYR